MASKWISGAIQHPGALHADLGVPAGQKIPAGKLAAAASKPGIVGKRANLAETLAKMHGAADGAAVGDEVNKELDAHESSPKVMPAKGGATVGGGNSNYMKDKPFYNSKKGAVVEEKGEKEDKKESKTKEAAEDKAEAAVKVHKSSSGSMIQAGLSKMYATPPAKVPPAKAGGKK